MRLLDLFCGRWGWSRAFAARGWECWGIDLVSSPLPSPNAKFTCADILELNENDILRFQPDFITASSPCEEFSVHGMRMFHPNPPYPEMGIRLFNHTRQLCESSGIPYVMENVRSAERFVGPATHRCGPFALWGTGVPPLMPQGIKKGFKLGTGALVRQLKETGDKTALVAYRKAMDCWHSSKSPQRIANAAKVATIPIELANCVADYAERILEQRAVEQRT